MTRFPTRSTQPVRGKRFPGLECSMLWQLLFKTSHVGNTDDVVNRKVVKTSSEHYHDVPYNMPYRTSLSRYEKVYSTQVTCTTNGNIQPNRSAPLSRIGTIHHKIFEKSVGSLGICRGLIICVVLDVPQQHVVLHERG